MDLTAAAFDTISDAITQARLLSHRVSVPVKNAITSWGLRAGQGENEYQQFYADFYARVSQREASLVDAGRAMYADIEAFSADGKYYYDLEVLERSGTAMRARTRSGEELSVVDLVTNSYNDLDFIEENRTALVKFITEAPLSSCLSRKIAGRYTVHRELEQEVADFLGYEAAVLGTCGYITQLSTVFALFREGDVIFSDRHNHSSLVDGCKLSGAKVIVFDHLDYGNLEELLNAHRKYFNVAGVISDGVFSTKGAMADVGRLVTLARKNNCVSVVDDTHGVCVVGKKGRGSIDFFDERPDVLTGGFGKAFAGFGGFTVASKELATVIDVMGRQNINTSNLSPIVAAQSLINLRHYRSHLQEVKGELHAKISHFNAELARHGRACYRDPEHHIHPIFCFYGDHEAAVIAKLRVFISRGYLPSFFPKPVAPRPSLRFSLHRTLTFEQLTELASIIAELDLKPEQGEAFHARPAALA